MHKARQGQDRVSRYSVSLEQRAEKQQKDISKLKAGLSNLRQELEGAEQELKNYGGTMARPETAREGIRRAKKENTNLVGESEYSQSQTEYTRA